MLNDNGVFMKRIVAIGISGLAIGLLGILVNISSPGRLLEENLGLHGLFFFRGPRPNPNEVVIVTMDMDSVHHLNLDPKSKIWPRAVHARLIERLSTMGVTTIAMDIFFEKKQSEAMDQRLADAIRLFGKVVLSSSIQTNKTPIHNGIHTGKKKYSDQALINIEKVIPPLPLFTRVAAAHAPFPLPKIPVKINQFWTFKTSSGDLPTFPVVALHLFLASHHNAFIDLLKSSGNSVSKDFSLSEKITIQDNDLLKKIWHLKKLSLEAPELFKNALRNLEKMDHLEPSRTAALRSLLSIYLSSNSRYLNFYGYPGAIRTISYHEFFKNTSPRSTLDVKNKIAFVGISRRLRLDQEDGYHTVFSRADGADLSGVEIAATAFANLLDGSWIKPLSKRTEIAVLLVWGLLIAFGVYYLSLWLSLPTLFVVAGAYCFFSLNRFTVANVWWPLTTPLIIQIPLGYIGMLILKHRDIQRERYNISKAFGFYLPATVVNRLARDISNITEDSKTVHGTCLFTDAAQYTSLSEVLAPEQLRRYLNQYYEILFKPIRHHGGIISDVVGDAVLALWPATRDHQKKCLAACISALDINMALQKTESIEDHPLLPTRIGIHAGRMQLGSVGAMDHYEYRAVGDVVNTASRIESLNKYLNTRILVSETVLSNLNEVQIRPVGKFTLVGKSTPITLFELLTLKENVSQQILDFCEHFREGLELFYAQSWSEAEASFNRAIQTNGGDGPAAFYIRQCRRFSDKPPGDGWMGNIVMENK